MYYINLNEITEEHVLGEWVVQSRVVNTKSATNLFADIRLLEMQADCYRSVNGIERNGKWQVLREQEIIYNPQLKFFIEGEEVGNAIITQLRNENVESGNIYKLTLYFHTGLELVLYRQAA